MNAIRRKLRSREGASITFALLIFLVCAIASSAVIIAASTAGGRLSTLREMDERYYGVTAAAEVLRDRLDGKSVVLSYDKDEDGKKTVTDAPESLLGNVSKALIENPDGADITDSTWQSIQQEGNADYTCKITGAIRNGLLTFNVSVTGGTINKDGTYTMQIVFASTTMEESAASNSGKAKVAWNLSSINKVK